MKVCLMIEGQEGVAWDDWVRLARACEELGFEGLFRSDHYLSFWRPQERGALDAWGTVTALAALTRRIRLGTMVSPVTFRHPSVLAKMAVTADHVSGGRIELAMGAGWFEREHRAYGFPFPPPGERIDRLAEQLEIVHRLLGGEGSEVTFHGAHYQLEACPPLPRPVQRPHPPIIVGGGAGPRSAALAARWADEYNVVYVDPAGAKQRMERLSAACQAVGRDPTTLRRSLLAKAVVGATEDDVRRRTAEVMRWTGEDGDVDAYLGDLRAQHVAGTPEQVLERLAEYAAVGIERVLLQHLVHGDQDAVELIGREIVPDASDL